MTSLNEDVLYKIASFVERMDGPDDMFDEYVRSSLQKDLTALRLVNRVWCKSATPHLFRAVSLATENSSKRPSAECLQQMRLSPLTVYFRTLHIPFPALKRDETVAAVQGFINDLVFMLPVCLTAFQNLRAVTVYFPRSFTPDYERLPSVLRHMFDRCVVNALKYAPVLHLTELALELPAAEDFRQLLPNRFSDGSRGAAPWINLLARLRYLSVLIHDKSGPGGQRYRTLRLSAVQRQFPNDSYASDFFSFIRLASNVIHLKITCTHMFELDELLRPEPSTRDVSFKSIQYLEVDRVTVHARMLRDFLSLHRAHFRGLIMTEVELTSGTWEAVFQDLQSLPVFITFKVQSCGYVFGGETEEYAHGVYPPINDPQDLESRRGEDHIALCDLHRTIIRRRESAGLCEGPHLGVLRQDMLTFWEEVS